MRWWWIVGAMLAYGLLHSALADARCKAWAMQRWGWNATRYRLVYNLIALIALVPVLALARMLPDTPLYRWPSGVLWLGWLLQGIGLLLMGWALAVTDTPAFLGLRPPRDGRLTTRGPYRWMRHPLYTGGLLVLWGTPVMSRNRAALYAAITVYLLVGAWLEERRLLAHFGADYAAYRRRTPDLSYVVVAVGLLALLGAWWRG